MWVFLGHACIMSTLKAAICFPDSGLFLMHLDLDDLTELQLYITYTVHLNSSDLAIATHLWGKILIKMNFCEGFPFSNCVFEHRATAVLYRLYSLLFKYAD